MNGQEKVKMTPEEHLIDIQYQINLCKYVAPKEMMENSSVFARGFIELASGLPKQGYYSLYDLYARSWHEDEPMVLDFFNSTLDDRAKIEVLAFYTSYIHELTHHTDMMITPFGVNYHLKLCREYLNFQSFGRELLNNSHLIMPFTRIIDYESNLMASLENSDSHQIYKTWNVLKGQLYYFDALFDTYTWGQRNAIEGWVNKTHPALILNQEFERITVRDFFLTIRISEANKYLTPIAILECRALINCILWMYWTMGDTFNCKNAILLYLTRIYQQATPEYTFILNLFSQYFGSQNIQNFIEEHCLEELKGMLFAINSCCWYALQAPPPTNQNSLHNSNPIARLLISIKAFQEIAENNVAFEHTPAFLNRIDSGPAASSIFLQPISSILNCCLQCLNSIKKLNIEDNNNQTIKCHFDKIIDTQIAQINKRKNSEFPYASLIGLADDGNPLIGIEDNELDSLLLDYIPDENTEKWFRDRYQLLFQVRRDRTDTVEILERWF